MEPEPSRSMARKASRSVPKFVVSLATSSAAAASDVVKSGGARFVQKSGASTRPVASFDGRT